MDITRIDMDTMLTHTGDASLYCSPLLFSLFNTTFHPFVAEQVEYGAFGMSAGVGRPVSVRCFQNVLDLDLSGRLRTIKHTTKPCPMTTSMRGHAHQAEGYMIRHDTTGMVLIDNKHGTNRRSSSSQCYYRVT